MSAKRPRSLGGKPSAGSRRLLVALLGGVVLPFLGACGTGTPSPGELGWDQQILASCPPDKLLASDVRVDVSGTSRTAELEAERSEVIRDVARQTTICGGRLRVSMFSASSAATQVLYDEELLIEGATDNARLRQVPQVVDEIMRTVGEAYGAKIGDLTPDGSDIVAQYRLESEYIQQLGDGYQLHSLLLTDGFQASSQLGVGGAPLTPAEAAALAEQVDVPKLRGASVTVAGVGKVTGAPPPSDVVEGLIHFYDALCARTEAASCLSVTDYTSAGR